MKTYLVGGAVRDRLLGLTVGERDWVVVGASPEQMRAAGYTPVGKDFPVFLHPQSKEEYALARTERKTAVGYHGFEFHTGPEVTLEDDLIRRDLTINAMAEDDNGDLIDPHGGQRDLQARVLRHVSEAFAEDPVRILRLARFHARFAALGFTVADETLAVMRQMVEAGEVDALVPERIWQEMRRALMCERPSQFIETLRACGALARILPEVDALFGVPQTATYHPEIDTGVHVMMALDLAAAEQQPLEVCYAVLLHDLGKALTPERFLPSHRGHEKKGVPPVQAVSERLRAPKACAELARIVTLDHLNVHRAAELRGETLLKLLERMDAFRQPERLEQVIAACSCDARGRGGEPPTVYAGGEILREAYERANAIQARDVMADGVSGPEIGQQMRARRIAVLEAWRGERANE